MSKRTPLTMTKEREAKIRFSMHAEYEYGPEEQKAGEGQELLKELDACREALQQAEQERDGLRRSVAILMAQAAGQCGREEASYRQGRQQVERVARELLRWIEDHGIHGRTCQMGRCVCGKLDLVAAGALLAIEDGASR